MVVAAVVAVVAVVVVATNNNLFSCLETGHPTSQGFSFSLKS